MKRYPVQMEIAGDTAMWTRPDTGDSPVSYPAPTYSAVRNIFQAVLWGQSVQIIPLQVDICRPLRFETYNTNYGGPLRSSEQIKKGNSYQLMATVLVDVCYRFYADVVESELPKKTKKTKAWLRKFSQPSNRCPDPARKHASPAHAYQEIFERRLNRGQCFHTPFLGWKEFTPSYFGPFREGTRPADVSTVLPSMFRDTLYVRDAQHQIVREKSRFLFDQNIMIEHGVMKFQNGGVQ